MPLLLGAVSVSAADLALDFQDSPNIGAAGGLFSYTLTVANNGPTAADTANAVNLTFNMPFSGGNEALFVGATPSGAGTCNYNAGPKTVTCSGLGNLALNQSTSAVVTVRLPLAGVYSSSASASSASLDPNSGNNGAPQTTTAQAASDLVLSATPSSSTVVAGQEFVYTLGVSNQGPDPLPGDASSRISFAVPSNASITARPTGSGWSCLPATGYPLSTGTIDCTRAGGLAVAADTADLLVPAVVHSTGTITANFSVSASQSNGDPMPDGNPANNSQAPSVTASTGSDVALIKGASATVLEQGTNVTYTLTASHRGGSAPGASGSQLITVTDTLPAGMNYVPGSASGTGWSCDVAGQVVTCTRPGPWIAGNYTSMPPITLVATASVLGSLENVAQVTIPEPDPDPVNNTGRVTITSSDQANLRGAKITSFGNDPAVTPIGSAYPYNYGLAAQNTGPLVVRAGQTITLVDTVPVNVTVTGIAPGPWTCIPSSPYPLVGNGTTSTISCSLTLTGTLAVNAYTPLVGLTAHMTAAGTSVNQVCSSLSGTGGRDDDASNDCGTANVKATVDEVDVSIVKTITSPAAPHLVRAGEDLTYQLLISNAGPAIASNVRVRDSLTNLVGTGSVQSVAIDGGGTCSINGGPSSATLGVSNGSTRELACNIPALNSGASVTLTVVVRPGIAISGTRTNVASAYSEDIGDTDRTNNQSTIVSPVDAQVNLVAGKTASHTSIPAGAPLTFVVSVNNQGPSTAQAVTLTDSLPANATFIDLTADSGGSCTTPAIGAAGGSLQCTWASLPSGAARTVTYRVRPTTSGDTVTNNVSVATSTLEADLTDNAATTSTPVTNAVLDIVVNKSDNPNIVDLGDSSLYSIAIINGGPSAGTGLTMVDTFPVNAPGGEAPTAVFSYQGELRVYKGGVEITADASQYSCTEPALDATAGVLSCTFSGAFDSGLSQARLVTYRLRAESISGVQGSAVGTSYNAVAVSVNETETQLDNNQAVEATSARRENIATDLGGTKTSTPAALLPEQNVVYTLTVSNNGGPNGEQVDSLGAQLIDPLPAGLTYVSSTPSGACAASGTTLTCQVGTLAAGASRVFTITARLAGDYSGPNPLVNQAQIDAPGDWNPGNNTPRNEVPVIKNSVGAPTLSQWALILLSLLMGVMALGMMGSSRLRLR
ncbi:MAG: IPTL-CTERM sorting domain-containing protein [Pseudomonas sp.]|uniref:IPTL-CTERM sorting domain-containing protein n=1 Tax=Pseudomonas sp. TaxID=306 RepID=UPI00339795BD